MSNLTEADTRVLSRWVSKQRLAYPEIPREHFNETINSLISTTRFIKESKEDVLTEADLQILDEGLMDWIKKGWGAVTSAIANYTSKMNDKAQQAIVDSVNAEAIKKSKKMNAALQQVVAAAGKALQSPTLSAPVKAAIQKQMASAQGQLAMLKLAMAGKEIVPGIDKATTVTTNAAGEAAIAASVETMASTDVGAENLVKNGALTPEQLTQILTALQTAGVTIGEKSAETVTKAEETKTTAPETPADSATVTPENAGTVDPKIAATFIARYLQGARLNVTTKDGSPVGVPIAEQDEKAIASLASNFSKMIQDKGYCSAMCPSCSTPAKVVGESIDWSLFNSGVAKDIVSKKLNVKEVITLINTVTELSGNPPSKLMEAITTEVYRFHNTLGTTTLKEGLELKSGLECAAGILTDVTRHFDKMTVKHNQYISPSEERVSSRVIKESTDPVETENEDTNGSGDGELVVPE